MNELILIESQTARTDCLSDVTPERAVEILSKAKAIIHFATTGSGQLATREQLAEFYEVSDEALRKALSRHKEEFKSDGYKTITGKDLKAFLRIGSDSGYPTKNITRLGVWTPRAALRLGLILRDSQVASQVRTEILDRALKPTAPAVPAIAPEEFAALQKNFDALAEYQQNAVTHFNEVNKAQGEMLIEAYERIGELEKMQAVLTERTTPQLSSQARRHFQDDYISRRKINTAVDWYARDFNLPSWKVWNQFYKEFHDTTGYCAPARANALSCKNLDAVERDGMLYDFYEFAWNKVFGDRSGLGQVR